MGKKKVQDSARRVLGSVGNMYGIKSASEVKDESNRAAEAREDDIRSEAQKQIDAAKEAEAQQEAVRKKMASLGRLQAGYTFSDSGASTGSTKVFS